MQATHQQADSARAHGATAGRTCHAMCCAVLLGARNGLHDTLAHRLAGVVVVGHDLDGTLKGVNRRVECCEYTSRLVAVQSEMK